MINGRVRCYSNLATCCWSPLDMPEPAEGEGKVPIPEGVIPIFLSTATQQIFEVVSDSDVTADKPHKPIPKEKFLQDVKNRAAVSDFQPHKQKITVRTSSGLGSNLCYIAITQSAVEHFCSSDHEIFNLPYYARVHL